MGMINADKIKRWIEGEQKDNDELLKEIGHDAYLTGWRNALDAFMAQVEAEDEEAQASQRETGN